MKRRPVLAAAMILLAGTLAVQAAQQKREGVEASNVFVSPPTSLLLYRLSSVGDSGGAANTGFATSITCTNLTSIVQNVRIQVFQYNGTILKNAVFPIASRSTTTASTHSTAALFDDVVLSADTRIFQGSAVVKASTNKVICSAMMLDASSSPPGSMAELHMVRFNPINGTLE